MKSKSRLAQHLALLAPVAVLTCTGCGSTPLRRSTSEFPSPTSPTTWVHDGQTMVNPVALTTNRAPVYPMALRRAGVEGLVNVDAVISATGEVMLASVADSTDRSFDSATLETVRDWTFQPATRNGVPVAMAVRLPVGFAMER